MYLNYISFQNSFSLWEPPKFKVNYITFDIAKSCFIVEFNRIPNEYEAFDFGNYAVKFEDKRLKLKSAVIDSTRVYLFPEMLAVNKKLMTGKIKSAARKELDLNDLISVKVKPITDVDGNILHKWKKRDYNQFREYFVQRVKPKTELPKESQIMNKRRPIFKDQPIVRPENFGDYWMNTPLQKLDNKKPAEQ